MARTKKPRTILSTLPEVLQKQQILNELVALKLSLVDTLIQTQQHYNSLGAPAGTAEEWLYSLPIDSLKKLEEKALGTNKRTKLGDLKTRAKLRRVNDKVLEELESINRKIRYAQLDLVAERLNATLRTDNEI